MNILTVAVTALIENKEEALGLTWGALMLWWGGALGGFARALISQTQRTFSHRTMYDMLVGGFSGLVLPIIGQRILPLSLDLSKLTALDKAAIAFFVGLSGSLVFTATGWRMGWIRPSGQNEPRQGEIVYSEKKDASGKQDSKTVHGDVREGPGAG